MHGGKSEGLTHESLCHHHWIPHQFEWEKSSMNEIEKEIERKEKGRREKERKGKKERTSRFSSDRRLFNGWNSSDREANFVHATITTRRYQKLGGGGGGFTEAPRGRFPPILVHFTPRGRAGA